MLRGRKTLACTVILSMALLLLAGTRLPAQVGGRFIAYDIPAGTVGNQTFTGFGLAMDFDVLRDIRITRLGVFDSGSNGLTRTLTSSIWDRGMNPEDNPTQVELVEFTPGDPGDLVGGSRFKAIQLNLPAGFRGTIMATGFGPDEPYGDTKGAITNPFNETLNDGGCAILFTGGGRLGGDAMTFPELSDFGPPNRYLAGTFEFEPLESLPPPQGGVPYIAYNVPAGVKGNDASSFALGMDFDVRADVGIKVTRLGVFDSDSNGLKALLTARLYNRDSGVEVARLDFTAADPGNLVGGSRFKDLPGALDLAQGFKGTIVGEGFNADDTNGNLGVMSNPPAGLTMEGGNCAIAFVGGGRRGAKGEFPTMGDTGPPNRYAAGTFVFEVHGTVNPPPGAPSNLVLVAGDGKIDLSWTAPAGGEPAAMFRVFRGESLAGAFTQIAEVAGTTYTDSPLTNEVQVCYFVRSVSAAGVESIDSVRKCEVPRGPTPGNRFVAYEVPQGTAGNQAAGIGLGMDFDVLADIRILQLGVFDDGSDGLNLPIAARIFDRDTREERALVQFTPESQGVLVGGSRFKALGEPLELPAGFHGSIVASGYGASERNGNQGVGPVAGLTTNGGECRIAFVGSSRFGSDATSFPATADGGPVNRYAAGTFEFEPVDPTFEPVPLPPLAVAADIGDASIDVSWQPAPSSECALATTGYRILRSTGGAALEQVAEVPETQTSYTDSAVLAGVDYCYVILSLAGEEVSRDSPLACATPGRYIAYVVPGGTIGARTDGLPLGMDFDVKLGVQVTRLGAFDSSGDGLEAPITVRLFNRETDEELAMLEFTPEDPGTLLNGSRFKPLAAPVDLPAGFRGTIVASGYGMDEAAGEGGAWSTDPGPCSLHFTGTGRSIVGGALLPLPNAAGRPDQYAAGTFEFVPVELATPHGAIAYIVPAGTVGNQEAGVSLGHDFDVNVDIDVTRLGVFDSGSNGLARPITARLYDRDSRTVLAELVFTAADPGELVEGSRFKDLETPLSLPAGFHGTMSASGYGAGEPNGNGFSAVAGVPWTVDDGGCAITFVGRSRFGATAAEFPGTVDNGPVNRFAAGTFEFETGEVPAVTFKRGDADQNGTLQITDAVQILGFLFLGVPTGVPDCRDAADTDDNGSLQLTDAVRILGFLFLGGLEPAPPFAACGMDPTPGDALDCLSFAACP